MLQLVQDYHSRLRAEAASAGDFRLTIMAIRMLLSLLLIAASALLSSVLHLDQPARAALTIPIGGLTLMMILHLGYVFTEGFQNAPQPEA
ncbi:hypothetical protein ACLB0R_06675 [Sphingomonas sp. GlSt437]|uniref:hypothetical protein n=1 Tax=Sphingomonas sp. GlSt437 TaxID=3389970 RepID=UPI003A85B1F8